MTIADELKKLQDLYYGGAISVDEFQKAKSLILAGPSPDSPAQRPKKSVRGCFLSLMALAAR